MVKNSFVQTQLMSDSVMEKTLEKINRDFTSYKKLPLPTTDGYVFIALKDILYCQAVTNYTQFKLINNKTIVSSYTLRHFEDMLKEQDFVRVHKSYLVNLSHVQKYLRKGILILEDGKEIEVSKTYRNILLKKIKSYLL